MGRALQCLALFFIVQPINIDAVYVNCHDWFLDSGFTNGTAPLDPKGQGSKNAECLIGATAPQEYIMVILHNKQTRAAIPNCNGKACAVITPTYSGFTMDELQSLKTYAHSCEQYLKWECQGMSKHDSIYRTANNTEHHFFRSGSGCRCVLTDVCKGDPNADCRCSSEPGSLSHDSGYFTTKDDLPLLSLGFGDTDASSEKGFYTLGPLRCYYKLPVAAISGLESFAPPPDVSLLTDGNNNTCLHIPDVRYIRIKYQYFVGLYEKVQIISNIGKDDGVPAHLSAFTEDKRRHSALPGKHLHVCNWQNVEAGVDQFRCQSSDKAFIHIFVDRPEESLEGMRICELTVRPM